MAHLSQQSVQELGNQLCTSSLPAEAAVSVLMKEIAELAVCPQPLQPLLLILTLPDSALTLFPSPRLLASAHLLGRSPIGLPATLSPSLHTLCIPWWLTRDNEVPLGAFIPPTRGAPQRLFCCSLWTMRSLRREAYVLSLLFLPSSLCRITGPGLWSHLDSFLALPLPSSDLGQDNLTSLCSVSPSVKWE